MKRALVAAFALVSTSFTPITIAMPAQAAVPTAMDKQAACDAYIAGLDPSVWRTKVVNEGMTPGTAEEIAGTEADIETTRVGDPSSLQTPAGTRAFYGAVGRHGGSPNLFSTVGWTAKLYASSLVDRDAEFEQTDTYTWDCEIEERVTTHVPVGNPNNGVGNPGQGNCVGDPSDGVREDLNGPGRGLENSNENSACHGGQTRPEHTWTYRDTENESSEDTYSVGRQTTATQAASPISFLETANAPYFQGDVVVCNSPTKNPGTWRAQNGYDGTNCNSAYFLNAPHISGADVFSSNSLPAQ